LFGNNWIRFYPKKDKRLFATIEEHMPLFCFSSSQRGWSLSENDEVQLTSTIHDGEAFFRNRFHGSIAIMFDIL